MSDPFVGEIRMFAGNFAPQGWAFCNGQLLAISQNEALFSLLGTAYGGDGRTTFALPDLRGRIPLHAGSGPGLSPRPLGSSGGTEKETVTINQMAPHSHPFQGSDQLAASPNPAGNAPAQSRRNAYINEAPGSALAPGAVTSSGGSQSHTNLMPYLCVNFIIALFGIYPSRQ